MSFVRHGIGDHGPNADGTGETAPSGTGKAALSGHMREGERIPERESDRSDGMSGPGRIGRTLPRVPAEAPVRRGT
ncbi:MAG: hypothetical protein OXD36_05055 [Rhodobacter sp.]|nr:hypothetical protein [Rhodobacter sp.]